ncbi:MAG: hypothetical protein V2J02_09960 [Pseudomonadales bacterium]|nr:hypothetical protein [Pseudomonadales bacterium]
MTLLARLRPAACVVLLLHGAAAFAAALEDEPRWWKGNTHTHSWWSDGDAPPELVALWYAEHGYDFLVFSEHNVMARGETWYPIDGPRWSAERARAIRQSYTRYREVFGDHWVVDRIVDGRTEVRLKPLEEFAPLFESAGSFLLIPGEEITAKYLEHPVHMNGVNLAELVQPRFGESIGETIQSNLDAVRSQEAAWGRPMLLHVNHPNFHLAMQPEDFFYLDHEAGEGFFEMYNGHPAVGVNGDAAHLGTERMWDVILSWRLGRLGRSVLYGVAVDDAHEYTAWGVGETNPGRGWVMVRARRLTPDSITAALKAGDFYNSTGVTLRELDFGEDVLRLAVEPEEGVSYRIEFVGTRRGAPLDGRVERVRLEALASGPAPSLPARDLLRKGVREHEVVRYPEEIGTVFARVEGPEAEYRLRGDEVYVRARVVSDRLHPNPHEEGDVEMAWTQPLVPDAVDAPVLSVRPNAP